MFVDEPGFVEYVTVSYTPTTAPPDLDAGRFLAEQASAGRRRLCLPSESKTKGRRTLATDRGAGKRPAAGVTYPMLRVSPLVFA